MYDVARKEIHQNKKEMERSHFKGGVYQIRRINYKATQKVEHDSRSFHVPQSEKENGH